MDLTCYVYDGWEPRIRPASPKRDWMEETPDRFAYRCLPLAIANSHGWEVLSPCGFSARWNGGQGAECVEIRVDAGCKPHQVPVSLFGAGTITFHLEGLIRTPEGWNLWVGGPPNGVKHGIAPLGGVIETDWSPYTFTMNWRFTRANEWIRFEEDEPFLFFFPVQRGVVGGAEPRIRPIAEVPELKEAFDAWSKSRNEFQKWVVEANPVATADRWQKLYYRGLDPAGVACPVDHESKLRVAPFHDSRPRPATPKRAAPAAKPTNPSPADAQSVMFAAAAGAALASRNVAEATPGGKRVTLADKLRGFGRSREPAPDDDFG